MENASKALEIAGGILLALMIIGALVLAFNKISAYQKTKTDSQKNSQTAMFNQDFLKYFDEKSINGTDIISLVYKVIDYNAKIGSGNYIDYEKKMILHINVTGFADKHAGGNSKLLGNRVLYDIKYANNANKYENNDLIKAIVKYTKIEKKYTLLTMKKLTSSMSNIKNGSKTVKDVTGKEMSEFEDFNEIEKYDEYTKFKSSKFIPLGNPVYNEGQLVELSFKFSN